MSILIGTDLADSIIGSSEDDTIFELDSNGFVNGKGGDDTIFGGDSRDSIFGSLGKDVIFGEDGRDLIFGGSGDDTITGGNGNDVIIGGNGDDVIVGGNGEDLLSGGNGEDVFVFDGSDLGLPDEITDFTSGEDKILIQGVGSEATVEYDSTTGILSVNGSAFIQLDVGLDISEDDYFIS